MIDEAGRRTEYKYDSMQQLIEVKDPRGAITKMTYDNRGNRTSVIDPAGKTTFFIYDLNDRLIQERRLAVTNNTVQEITKHLFRDQAGRLVKVAEGIKGGIFRASQYSYNNLDRIIQLLLLIESPTSTQVEDAASYAYSNQLDAELLVSANNNIAHLGFGNDLAPPFKTSSFSLAAHQSGNPLNLLEGNYSISRDISGEISAISTNGNAIFSKSYDPAGRLTGINAGSGTGTFSAALSYDGFGRKSGISYADGTTAQMLYDSLNRATNIAWSGAGAMNAGVPISESLSYDQAGNITQLTREHGSYTLGYDSVDQLVSSSSNGNNNFVPYNRAITYDFLGNRINDSVNGVGNFSADFLQSNAQSSFLADGYGSVAQVTSGSIIKNYTYRADAHTASFQSGNVAANYFFDALDRRVAKSFNDNGQQFTQSYLHLDKEDRVLLAKAGNGDIYTYLDGQGIDEHLGHLNGITAKYYVTDHLGSVLNGDAAGSAKTFGHSGEVVSAPALSISSNPSIYGFAGGTHNPESGTITFGVRDYDANSGRWLSQDPIGLMAGANRYSYVGDNPLGITDPFGLEPTYGPIPSTDFVLNYLNTPAGQQAIKTSFGDLNNTSQQNYRYVAMGDEVLDLRHVAAAYNKTNEFTASGIPSFIAAGLTYSLGLGLELDQAAGGRMSNLLLNGRINNQQASFGKANSSAFSYEDLSSNDFGIKAALSKKSIQDYLKFGGSCE